MHLNLTRYAIIWTLDRLDDIITRLKPHREAHPEIKDLLAALQDEYFVYVQNLRRHQ